MINAHWRRISSFFDRQLFPLPEFVRAQAVPQFLEITCGIAADNGLRKNPVPAQKRFKQKSIVIFTRTTNAMMSVHIQCYRYYAMRVRMVTAYGQKLFLGYTKKVFAWRILHVRLCNSRLWRQNGCHNQSGKFEKKIYSSVWKVGLDYKILKKKYIQIECFEFDIPFYVTASGFTLETVKNQINKLSVSWQNTSKYFLNNF